ncbi:MAG: DivIVA domain-containing protein [Cyclobacteriaceae bacterium]
MKITPLEIRQKDFEKKLRGYDKDEVTAFLLSLSNEWERVLDTNKELTLKLQHAEKEVAKLREVESSLYKTLKTAEDTGANLIDQSNKAAELHMRETQMRAEALMNEAKSKAKAMMEKAEVEARQIIEELQEAVKSIEQNHRDIENHRQNAIAELKNLSVDLIEKVERTNKEQKQFKFDDYVKRVKELARESGERIRTEDTDLKMPDTPKIEDIVPAKEEEPEPVEMKKPVTSEEAPKTEASVRVTKTERGSERISRTVVVDMGKHEAEPANQTPVPETVEKKEETPKVEEEPKFKETPEPEQEEPPVAEVEEPIEPEVKETPEMVEEEPDSKPVEKESEPESVQEPEKKEPEPKQEEPEFVEKAYEEQVRPKTNKTVSFFDQLDRNN